jgi:uncharacterized surface protein with fasciclin (FAS1) repeats
MKPTILLSATAIAALLTLPASAPAQSTGDMSMENIVQIAAGNGNFTTLVAAVKAAGLAETLQGNGPFTVFAPTDAAFAKLPPGTVDALLKDKEKLTAILTLHVLAARVLSNDIVAANGASPTTVNGETLQVEVRDGSVYVNGARVVTADIMASNGVIHVIDTVLLPAPAGAAR